MEIYPAIDLRDGKSVRLTKGDYDRMKVYDDDPAGVARGFLAAGARRLHVVDLDGARTGVPQNAETVRALTAVGLQTQLGGGIRDEKRIEEYLSWGISRVILGTVAVRDFAFTERMVKRYGDAIAVGVDARDGQVAVSGWEETTSLSGIEFCRRLRDAGVKTVIYTDIGRDGCLQGANLPLYQTLSKIEGLDVIASGGVSYEGDLTALNAMGLHGAIVGKALYEGKLTLRRCLELVGRDCP
ncbi:MAG: 1-(5-phosphoribosyl)-5-[(5-phosphoribosylamino)methylideneamino]imidazole-4-carboxamide isomerase [Christensenellales bacterium]|nr:1-(5-phosphoribosyl)-5-[(5-phosphoribosylamino)methylideneamino]imidazole-4-carboxamide isomerase [Christensenellales bacterium]